MNYELGIGKSEFRSRKAEITWFENPLPLPLGQMDERSSPLQNKAIGISPLQQQVRDFVEFWGRNFSAQDVSDYLEADIVLVKRYLKVLEQSGIIIKLSHGMYVKRRKHKAKVKSMAMKCRKLDNEYLRTIEQANILKGQLLRQKATIDEQIAWIDGFVGEMEALCN